MKKIEQKSTITYGGEIEALAVDIQTQKTLGIPADFLGGIESSLLVRDSHGKPPNMGYDSSEHLLEIGLGVHSSLMSDVRAAKESVGALQEQLSTVGASLISSSYHPIENPKTAYTRVLPKPIYELIRGQYQDSHIHPAVLAKVYPSHPEVGRGWHHESGTLAAAIQPWNSLTPESAIRQISVLQRTGFIFNLLLANSPFAYGKPTDKRDYRLEMWGSEGIMSTSRYSSDIRLTENLPCEPRGLVDYYKYVLGNQRPLVIPYMVKKDIHGTEYKMNFMAVVQPLDKQHFSILDYLEASSVPTIDIETGETVSVKPSVAHIINGFDFLYFPRFGARLRLSLPEADRIDCHQFVQAIRNGDEQTFQALLRQGGVDHGGFICAEGRVAATVLPTASHPKWERMNIPFVLQTALVRGYTSVERILNETGLNWQELSHLLPQSANQQNHAFDTTIRGVNATDLAKKIWQEASKTLLPVEKALVGNEIETILQTHQAPAEEQIAYVENIIDSCPSFSHALLCLLESLHVVIPKR